MRYINKTFFFLLQLLENDSFGQNFLKDATTRYSSIPPEVILTLRHHSALHVCSFSTIDGSLKGKNVHLFKVKSDRYQLCPICFVKEKSWFKCSHGRAGLSLHR